MERTTAYPPPNLKDYEAARKHFSWAEYHDAFSFRKSGKVNYAYEIADYQCKKGHGGKPAFVSQRSDGTVTTITFAELSRQTNALALNLKRHGLKPNDRFALYAPKSIEYALILLSALKCGAIAVPLFEAFGGDAIRDRIADCGAAWLYAPNRLLKNLDLDRLAPPLKHLITDKAGSISASADIESHLISGLLHGDTGADTVVWGDLETPFILHYTSGSTAKPKGILLSNRAMIGHLVTAKFVLDLHPEDRYWNTGDPGWVTGMVYNFFAPLLMGVAAHFFEGPFQPDAWMKFMSEMHISVWYSTPTAFRLLRYYDAPLRKDKMPALRHIVSAGEPLNPELIDWTEEKLGIPIYDSWYMTENGHQLINNYRALPIKKGSMGKPLPGIHAAVIDERGNELPSGSVGRLAIRAPWPGLMKDIWNDPERFQAYFQNGWYISGDTAVIDADGYFWFQGREDDMIKSAAERISPFEVENALLSHRAVAESGVIGVAHKLYGNIIKAFILLNAGYTASDDLKGELIRHVREKMAAHAAPREIEFVDALPKTRSGKIMRRVLRARETGDEAGDLSTLDSEMNPAENNFGRAAKKTGNGRMPDTL